MNKVSFTDHKGHSFKVIAGTDRSQLAVMTLAPGKQSGAESGHTGDQIVLVLEGTAELLVGDERATVAAGEGAIIPAGTRHQILNPSEREVFLVSVYAPPSY